MQKTRMAATGKHLKSCYEATKTGFSLGAKKVIDKVKRQHVHSRVPNFGASKLRDALLDEGFSKADLPPVKQIPIYLNSKKSQVHPATTLKGFKINSPKWDQCMQGKVMIFLFLLCMQGNSQWNSIFLACWWWRNNLNEKKRLCEGVRTKASCTNWSIPQKTICSSEKLGCRSLLIHRKVKRSMLSIFLSI